MEVNEVVKFQPNIPVRFKLKYPEGKACKSRFSSEDQFMISSEDGRIAFLTPFAHERLKSAGVTRGDDVEITQTVLQQGARKRIDWSVRKVEAEKAQAASAGVSAPAPAVSPVQYTNLQEAPVKGPDVSVSQRPMTTLDDALITAIAACKRAEEYGQSVGYTLKFDKDDVRSMAITLLIGKQREFGGSR